MSWFSEAVNFISGADTRQDAGHTMVDATKYWDDVQGPRSESNSSSTSSSSQGSLNTSKQGSTSSSVSGSESNSVQGSVSGSDSYNIGRGQTFSHNFGSSSGGSASHGTSQQQSSSTSHSEQFATFAENIATELSKLGASEYERYSNMFGGLEDNLNDYFNNLNPDMFAAQQNQSAQLAYDQTMGKIKENLAARGLFDSGTEAQMSLGMGMQLAQQKAQNAFNAPNQVAQMQQQWLGQGYNRMNAAMGAMGHEQVVTVGGGGVSDASSQSTASSEQSSSSAQHSSQGGSSFGWNTQDAAANSFGNSFGQSNSSSFGNSQSSSFGESLGTSFGQSDSSSQSHSLATDDSRKAQGLTDIAMGVASNQVGEGADRGNLFGGLIGMGTSAILGGLF